jgi:hypothetical protein
MAEAEWTKLDDGLDDNAVVNGTTYGIPRPNGGGNFVYGFNSKVTTEGTSAYFCNKVNFSPMAKGVSIRGCLQRHASGGPLNYAVFLFGGHQGTSVNDVAYILGLCDDNPSRIALRKGTLVSGLPASNVGTNGILARSTGTFAQNEWVHVRMDMIAQPNNETLIQCFWSDLADNPYQTPVWVPIPGIEEVVDDFTQILTGSAPLLDGRGGWGFYSKDVTRRGAVKHVEVWRQT